MTNEIIFFSSFLIFIIIILAADLGLFSKKDEVISFKKAGMMSFMMVTLALAFYFLLTIKGQYLHGIDSYEKLTQVVKTNQHAITLIPNHLEESLKIYNQNLGLEFLTGYIIEYALSVDNIFVIVLLFASFAVPQKYYHRVLFWGILGAIAMRFIFIFTGATLIKQFNWILYVFGAFLVFTGIKMLFTKEKEGEMDTENNKILKFVAKIFAVHPEYVGKNFFVKINGKRMVTTLFLVLIMVEVTDLIFAVDSIPAIFVVTKDPYIVFFSNIFAIMGLRSMFFLLVNIIHKFHYLKTGLAVLLAFIGIKMLAHHWLEKWGFTTQKSLIVILLILATSVVASLLFPKHKNTVNTI